MLRQGLAFNAWIALMLSIVHPCLAESNVPLPDSRVSNSSVASELVSAPNYGEEFTRPLPRFDFRFKYRNGPDGASTLRNVYRVDYPFLLPGRWNLSFRGDLPWVANNVKNSENSKGHMIAGLGDVLTQISLGSPDTSRLRYGAGLRVIWPSASEMAMGGGKYELVPGAGFTYAAGHLPEGSFYQFIWREGFSVGGESDRRDIHQSVLNPGISIALPRRAFVMSAPDILLDWQRDASWFVPWNLQIGKRFGKNIILSLEWNQAMIKQRTTYNWDIEARLGYFF